MLVGLVFGWLILQLIEGYARVRARGAAWIVLMIGAVYGAVWLASFVTKALFNIDISFPMN